MLKQEGMPENAAIHNFAPNANGEPIIFSCYLLTKIWQPAKFSVRSASESQRKKLAWLTNSHKFKFSDTNPNLNPNLTLILALTSPKEFGHDEF